MRPGRGVVDRVALLELVAGGGHDHRPDAVGDRDRLVLRVARLGEAVAGDDDGDTLLGRERPDAVDGVRAAQVLGHAVVDDLRAGIDAGDAEAR